MERKFHMRLKLAAVAIATMGVTGVAPAFAAPTIGPDSHQLHGLCTAYFAGSQNGQDHKHQAPPFVALEAAAEAADQSVAEFCAANDEKFKGEGGPGAGNGKH